ncbi:YaiI/YqxD family protein [Legionella nagasakiensis]|uniref:YaiI/YqxD family protein n=1 Tax=Legionella nagasakiensis TaxID=535290 RepID=UPI001055F69E|nr:YaiI/YqxD family protein [Legionella nagasakiensis]
MKIWIDGDACPNVIKDITFRAAIRTKTNLIIVSNHHLKVPSSFFIKKWIVAGGFDVADKTIISHVAEHDLVITADIPFAKAVIDKKATVLNPRGDLYTSNNIDQIFAMRNLNESLRSCGLITSGAAKMSQKEIQNFSNHLDKILTQYHRSKTC